MPKHLIWPLLMLRDCRLSLVTDGPAYRISNFNLLVGTECSNVHFKGNRMADYGSSCL